MAWILLGLAGCAHGSSGQNANASEQDELEQLRAAITAPVATPEQNAHNSELVERVAEKDLLQGMTREQVADKLGRGDVCSRHELCAKQGFEDDDWYYEVGEMGEGYARTRPVLIVGFDRFGKSTRVYNLRIE
jgi:hypothetical protein